MASKYFTIDDVYPDTMVKAIKEDNPELHAELREWMDTDSKSLMKRLRVNGDHEPVEVEETPVFKQEKPKAIWFDDPALLEEPEPLSVSNKPTRVIKKIVMGLDGKETVEIIYD